MYMRSVVRRVIGIALAVLVGLLVAGLSVACGGGGDEAASPTSAAISPSSTVSTSPTPGEITGGELQRMVLRQADLGPGYASFTLDEESGFAPKDQRAENDFDPADEAEDLDRFGFVNSYVESYSEPTLADPAAPLPELGPINADAEVLLFGDAASAGDYVADDRSDANGLVGSAYFGGRVESIDEFDVPGVGEAAFGARIVLLVSDESGQEARYYLTAIEFQRGRVVGFVGVTRVDDDDVAAEVTSLARGFEERIQSILAGEG